MPITSNEPFGFYRYETANFPLRIVSKQGEEKPLEDYQSIRVSIAQPGVEPEHLTEKDVGVDVEESRINVHLTQEQTGKFREGAAKLQVNIYYIDTERNTTAQGKLVVKENLYKQVMTG